MSSSAAVATVETLSLKRIIMMDTYLMLIDYQFD